MYYHAGQDHLHLNLGESNDVLLCKYFGFSFPYVTWPNLGGALSSHQKVTSFCQESIINMINDPTYDPLRQQIHNQSYLLIQMKISQMKKQY